MSDNITRQLSTLLLAAGVASCALASGPFGVEPAFVDYPYSDEELFSGRIQLAIGDGSGFSRRYHGLLAYLHLNGQYTAAHRRLFEEYQQSLASRSTGSDFYSGPSSWQRALAGIGIDEPFVAPYLVIEEPVQVNGNTYQRSRYIENCMPDAFATAAATLEQRKAAWGEQSPQLRRWVEAQRSVFSNCGAAQLTLPAPPQADWLPLERADRAYQIAASHFYNRQYEQAIRHFQAIADDPASPWRDISRYVIGRAHIRAAKINGVEIADNLRAAAAVFEALASSPAGAAFPSARGQSGYATVQADPEGFLRATGQRIVEAPESVDAQAFSDYLFMLPRVEAARLQDDTLASWLLAAQRDTAGTAEIVDAALQRWQQDRQLPWLLLAALKTDPQQPRFAEVLAALAEAPEVERHFVLFERRLQLLYQARRFDEVYRLADTWLRQRADTLNQAERNSLQRYLARASTTLPELLQHALMTPAGLYFTYGEYQPLSAARGDVAGFGTPSIETEAQQLINDYFSPAQFRQLIELADMPAAQQANIAKAGWVRALVAGDDDSAQFFAAAVARHVPALAAAMQQYLDGADKAFEAAYILLLNPGLSPYLDDVLGRHDLVYQEEPEPGTVFERKPDTVALSLGMENWWCAAYPQAREEKLRWLDSYAFTAALAPAQREEMIGVADDFSRTVTDYFARAVLDYAPAHRDDARVPRALHRVVFATRYACSRYDGVAEVSRAAFELLHRRYPDSEWAAQTPYWYD